MTAHQPIPSVALHGASGAGHPAVKRALQVYSQEWASLSPDEDAFLRSLRAADVAMNAKLEQARRDCGFGSVAAEAVKARAMRQRDADYANALAVLDAADQDDAQREAPPFSGQDKIDWLNDHRRALEKGNV